jgi:hypothetical protein
MFGKRTVLKGKLQLWELQHMYIFVARVWLSFLLLHLLHVHDSEFLGTFAKL